MADIKEISKDFIEDVKDIAEDAIEDIEDIIEDKSKVPKKQLIKKKPILIMLAVIVFLFVICVVLLITSFLIKQNALENSYSDAKTQASNDAYEEIYNFLHNKGKQRYVTSNKIGISITQIEKLYSLEVLKATEIDYYIHEGDKEYKSEAWYKITGSGTFIINMHLAEIITDEERAYILIRIPTPTLDQNSFAITVQQFHFKNNLWEGVGDGVGIAEKAYKEGYKNIKQRITENQDYLECAKNAAEDILINLAKDSNPDVNVEVEIEFF